MKERQKLIDDVMKDLRTQRDRQNKSSVNGSTEINPQQLGKAGSIATFGPFTFEVSFRGSLVPSFGQVLYDTTKPFIVQPYVHSWHTSQGIVDGFMLGLYALIDAPTGLSRHTITWHIEGKASHYRGDSSTEAWSQGYDLTKANHLEGT